MNKVIHFYESTEHRRNRLGGFCHGQSLCSNGNFHQNTSTSYKDITCNVCLDLLKSDKIYSIVFRKEINNENS